MLDWKSLTFRILEWCHGRTRHCTQQVLGFPIFSTGLPLLYILHSSGETVKVSFHFHSIRRPVRLRPNAVCAWFDIGPWIRGPLFTPDGSAGRAIPDYFGANQWCRTCVSGNGNHFQLIISKENQSNIEFFHCRLPLFPMQLHAVSRLNIVAKSNRFPFLMILVRDRKRVNIARQSVKDSWIGWWVWRLRPIGLTLSLGDRRSDVRLERPVRGRLDARGVKGHLYRCYINPGKDVCVFLCSFCIFRKNVLYW